MVDIDDYIWSTTTPKEYITKFIKPLLNELGVKNLKLSTIGEGFEGPWPPIMEEEANFFFNERVVSSSMTEFYEFNEPFNTFTDRLLSLLNLGPIWKHYRGNIFSPKSDEIADRQKWIDTKIIQITPSRIKIFLPLITVKNEMEYIDDDEDYSLMTKGEFLGMVIYFTPYLAESGGKNKIRCSVSYSVNTVGKSPANSGLTIVDSLNVHPLLSFMNWNKNPFATLK
jgi:hypothetical protein